MGYLLRRANTLLLPQVEALFGEHEFTFVQWAMLMQVRDGLASTCADISRNLNYDTGALTRVIDQLEGRGFVERQRSETDRRVVTLILTAEGKRAVDALIPVVVGALNNVLTDFTREEIEMLLGLLARLVTRLEELDRQPIGQR